MALLSGKRRFFLICAMWILGYTLALDSCYFDHEDNKALGKTVYTVDLITTTVLTDGDRLDDGPACLTTSQTKPWIVVDLGDETVVSTVVLVHSLRAASETPKIMVMVGSTFTPYTFDPVAFQKCSELSILKRSEIYYMHCDAALVGRYVAIFLMEGASIALCQIEVYSKQVFQNEMNSCTTTGLISGSGSLNIAKYKQAFQINTHTTSLGVSYPPSKALDESYDPESMSHTGNNVYSWWLVDLGKVLEIVGVAITNRLNWTSKRFKNFKVHVGNNYGPSTPFVASEYQLCAHMCHMQTKKRRYYKCKNILSGRHVAVDMFAPWLALREVEVYERDTHARAAYVGFPGFEMSLQHKAALLDEDPNTCVNIKNLRNRHPLFEVKMTWFGGQYDLNPESVSTRFCRNRFYVNVTHSQSLKISATLGAPINTWNVGSGYISKFVMCDKIAAWQNGEMVHTRLSCVCAVSRSECEVHIMIEQLGSQNYEDYIICDVILYD